MRIEDLDPDRSRPAFAQAALEDLRWLGVDWDEGPDVGGQFAPYEQSKRGAIYLAAWHMLREGGFIYRCRCSRKDLATALNAPHEVGARGQDPDDEPIHLGTCRSLASGGPVPDALDSAPGNAANWRFRVPDGEAIEFVDLNLGPQRFVAGVDFGDFVVWRRDGVPSYQLACATDDAAMEITEVVRGADLLKSTARQILLYRVLGLPVPAWFHCRLVLDAQGNRLAKRHDTLSVRALRDLGKAPPDVVSRALAGRR